MVPMEGVEPTRPCGHQILSLARLPIPPHRHPMQVEERTKHGNEWQEEFHRVKLTDEMLRQ